MTGAGGYEPVIGLEVHVQLSTRSKIFCACPTAFGAGANRQVCPVCLGYPGVLPVLNREAVALALRFGVAVGARIARVSEFARKQYFYPDLPKGYQITQYDRPLLAGGEVPFRVHGEERRVDLVRAHLEEDAGRSRHGVGAERGTGVDLNRCGVPLLEIVTAPGLRSPAEARACLEQVRRLVVELGICDGNMEEGSLRCDVNVSLREPGAVGLAAKTEVKNLNSFRHVERAVTAEIRRQTAARDRAGPPGAETRLWDERAQRTRPMRGKEGEDDYRYFPEPDLPPLPVDEAWIGEARAAVPELPWARERRFRDRYGLDEGSIAALTATPGLADYFEEAIEAAGDAAAAAAWMRTELLRLVKEEPGGPAGLKFSGAAFGRLVRMVREGTLSGPAAKRVLARMRETGGAPEDIAARDGLAGAPSRAELEAAGEKVVAGHPGPAAAYRAGKRSVLEFFVGLVMRATRGRADAGATREVLREILDRGEDAPGEPGR